MNILLGVSGGIAAYKMLGLASKLVKLGHEVEVCMTENAKRFVTPLSFEAIIKRKVVLRDDDSIGNSFNQHIRLAKFADVMIIAPASANTLAKLSHGISDNIVTLTALATTCQKLVYPAMNVNMYENDITTRNIEILDSYKNFHVIEADAGYLACGDIGIGRLTEDINIIEHINFYTSYKDMVGKKVLINAGPTIEKIDPVRYITNHSSGKMGYELARAFSYRGAEVTLISGKTNLKTPYNVDKIDVLSAKEMYDKCITNASDKDVIVLCAAVADYTPKEVAKEKIKKSDGNLTIELIRTQDILKTLGENKTYKLIGFAMETENLIENAKHKLINKNADFIVANSIKIAGAGFNADTNIATLVGNKGEKTLPKMSKFELANKIIDEINMENIHGNVK